MQDSQDLRFHFSAVSLDTIGAGEETNTAEASYLFCMACRGLVGL